MTDKMKLPATSDESTQQIQQGPTKAMTLLPGESATLHKKVPWVPVYRKITVSCPSADQILSLNRAESHRKAMKRVGWGLGILLVGTAISALLKQMNLQIIGNLVAGLGMGIIVHGLIIAQMMEHWMTVSICSLALCCAIAVYLFRNNGFTIPKIGKLRKPW